MSQYLITEGGVFTHEGKGYKLISRGFANAVIENNKGERITVTKEAFPTVFQELLV